MDGSMEAGPLTIPMASFALVAVGVAARTVAAVGTCASAAFPESSWRVRMSLAAILSIVALPAAWAASRGMVPVGTGMAIVLAGEALVGLAMGAAVAAVVGASGWAGEVLGSVSGLSWADDFDPAGDAQSAGIARLGRWLGLGAFVAAGGQQAIVAGLIDSVHYLPVGTAFPASGLPGLTAPEALILQLPAQAIALALTMAIPALVAVLAAHLATAICLRSVPCAPGPGLLQGVAALVLLGALYLGADAWGGSHGSLQASLVECCFPDTPASH
jgi:flagellar biosynthetic protein FliR